jgi:SAM-dependent methyltransferase
MSTDQHWVQWGQQDPYFAVITNPKFRSAALTDDARREFFASGEHHAKWVLEMARRNGPPGYAPRRALDFGCGVGRVSIPLAGLVPEVVGVDVSPAMLDEARRNVERLGTGRGVSWLLSDDTLSRVSGRFDLVHTFIVLQHIDVPRGRALFARLVELVGPGGVGALHVTYAKAYHAETFGQPPARPAAAGAPKPGADPEMQMNPYPLGDLAFVMQRSGIARFHTEFTDHGGELGVFLFFARPAS